MALAENILGLNPKQATALMVLQGPATIMVKAWPVADILNTLTRPAWTIWAWCGESPWLKIVSPRL